MKNKKDMLKEESVSDAVAGSPPPVRRRHSLVNVGEASLAMTMVKKKKKSQIRISWSKKSETGMSEKQNHQTSSENEEIHLQSKVHNQNEGGLVLLSNNNNNNSIHHNANHHQQHQNNEESGNNNSGTLIYNHHGNAKLKSVVTLSENEQKEMISNHGVVTVQLPDENGVMIPRTLDFSLRRTRCCSSFF